MFEIFKVPDDAADFYEQLGAKQKFWFRKDGQKYLFKVGPLDTGETWAEKVVAEVCSLLGIPHATYEFGIWRGLKGVISPSIVPLDGELRMGNELLLNFDAGYVEYKTYKQTGYTLQRVFAQLDRDINPPLGWNRIEGVTTALEVFTGYLLLDALVANQDRHHENWGVITIPDKSSYLAPTYDHAASLARNLTDTERSDRLCTKDYKRHIDMFVTKASSAFNIDANSRKRMSTVEAFLEARTVSPNAAEVWLSKLACLDMTEVQAIFNKIPESEITPLSAQFAFRMIELNRERLLQVG